MTKFVKKNELNNNWYEIDASNAVVGRLASIIAKIYRDRYMRFLSHSFPDYNWSTNVGYGTKKHIEQIYKKGITIHHRKSFEPIKSLIHNKCFLMLIT